MLIAQRNFKHDGVEYFKDEEVDASVFTKEGELEKLQELGAVKEYKSLSEKKRVEAQSEAPAEQPADAVATPAVPASEVNKNPEVTTTGATEGKPSASWTKTRLLDYAKAKNVEVTPDMTRGEIFDKLTSAGEASPDSAPTGEQPADVTANGAEAPATTETASPEVTPTEPQA